MSFQAVAHAAGLVIDAGIKAKFLDHELAFGGAAGNAHHTAALDSGHLADGLTDRTGRARDDNRLAGLGLPDIEQSEIGGHARHAERIEPFGQRRDAKVDTRQPGGDQCLGLDRTELLHPEHAADRVPHRKGRGIGGDDPTDTAGTHHITDSDRLDIAAPLVHPAAHRRIERQHEVFDKDAARGQCRHRRIGNLPVGGRGQANRARCEQNPTVDRGSRSH